MAGVDSEVYLVGVLEEPHITVEHNLDRIEANDHIRDRTLFHDLPHITDNEPSLGATIGSDGICRSHCNNATRELYNTYFSNKRYGVITGTSNMNLNRIWYNLYGCIKEAQYSRVNVKNINQGVARINVSDPTDFKMSGEDKMLHVLGVVLIQKFSLKAGLKRVFKEV